MAANAFGASAASAAISRDTVGSDATSPNTPGLARRTTTSARQSPPTASATASGGGEEGARIVGGGKRHHELSDKMIYAGAGLRQVLPAHGGPSAAGIHRGLRRGGYE